MRWQRLFEVMLQAGEQVEQQPLSLSALFCASPSPRGAAVAQEIEIMTLLWRSVLYQGAPA